MSTTIFEEGNRYRFLQTFGSSLYHIVKTRFYSICLEGSSPNPEKAQLFAESDERNFGIESHLFGKSHFDRINKFVEVHSYHFTLLDSLHDNVTDTDDDSDLVADVDPGTLIRIIRSELKNGKAPGIDNVYNDIRKKAIGTGFYKLLARAFTI